RLLRIARSFQGDGGVARLSRDIIGARAACRSAFHAPRSASEPVWKKTVFDLPPWGTTLGEGQPWESRFHGTGTVSRSAGASPPTRRRTRQRGPDRPAAPGAVRRSPGRGGVRGPGAAPWPVGLRRLPAGAARGRERRRRLSGHVPGAGPQGGFR